MKEGKKKNVRMSHDGKGNEAWNKTETFRFTFLCMYFDRISLGFCLYLVAYLFIDAMKMNRSCQWKCKRWRKGGLNNTINALYALRICETIWQLLRFQFKRNIQNKLLGIETKHELYPKQWGFISVMILIRYFPKVRLVI